MRLSFSVTEKPVPEKATASVDFARMTVSQQLRDNLTSV